MIGTQSAGGGDVSWVDTHITSAQILALHTTPITVVAAPGANKYIQFVSAVLFLDYNSAAYASVDAADNLAIKYNSGVDVVILETAGILVATADAYREAPHYATATAMDVTPAINTALEIYLKGQVTTGDSPMGVRVFYRTVDLSTLTAA